MSIYMKIEGISGDVTAKGFEKHIELDSFNFGVSKKVNQVAGNVTNREGSIPSFAPVTITQKIDQTTPLLFQNIAKSEVLKSVVIKCTATDGRLYHTITLSDVIISNYTENWDNITLTTEHHMAPKPVLTLALTYNKIEVQFIPLSDNNKAGSPVTAGYNLATAMAA